jgi:DNA-binding XRE family transcriptional regulator
LQECREAAKVSRYGLQKNCGVSRDMIGDIENGETVPTLFWAARMAYGMGLTLREFVAKLEAGEAQETGRL